MNMRRIKARLVGLGIRQVEVARDLGIEPTRFNRLLNGWLKPRDVEKERIRSYLKGRRVPRS